MSSRYAPPTSSCEGPCVLALASMRLSPTNLLTSPVSPRHTPDPQVELRRRGLPPARRSLHDNGVLFRRMKRKRTRSSRSPLSRPLGRVLPAAAPYPPQGDAPGASLCTLYYRRWRWLLWPRRRGAVGVAAAGAAAAATADEASAASPPNVGTCPEAADADGQQRQECVPRHRRSVYKSCV